MPADYLHCELIGPVSGCFSSRAPKTLSCSRGTLGFSSAELQFYDRDTKSNKVLVV